MFALPHHHQQPSSSLDYPLFSSPSPYSATPAYPSHSPSSSMYDLERLAYLAARQQQQEEEEERHRRRRQAELAAYLQAQRQRQQQAAFARAVQDEVERRLQAEKAAALRDALIRRAQLAQQQAEEEEVRRRQVALIAARRRQAALAAAAAQQQEQQRRRRLAVAAEEEQRRRVADARRRHLVSEQAADTFLKFLFALEEPISSPEPTKEVVTAPSPAAPVVAAPQPAAVEPAPTPTPAPSSAPFDFSQFKEAATVLQRHFRRHAARRTALSTLERLTSEFDSHKASFTAPSSFTFQSSPASTPSSSGTSTPPLAYGSANSSFLAYEHYLTTLLSKIDEVQSGGDRVVKQERKELVKRVEAELARLDGMKDEAWEKQNQESQAAAVVEQEKEELEDAPVEADVAQATPPTSDRPTSAFALDSTTATTGPATNLALAPESAEPATIPSPADEATSPTLDNSPANDLSSAPLAALVAPTPLTPSALASLPDATTLEDNLPASPASPPSRPLSRASTRSASSVASDELNHYIAEMLDRARKLGEEVERMEQEEKEEGEKPEQVEQVQAGEEQQVEPSSPVDDGRNEEKEEGVDEEIDVAAVLRRRKEQGKGEKREVESPAPAPAEEAPIDDSAEETTSATTDAKEGEEEKSEAGTEDFEVV